MSSALYRQDHSMIFFAISGNRPLRLRTLYGWVVFSLMVSRVLWANAQAPALPLLEISPAYPSPDDWITLTFYADRGNQALKDYRGDVYLHTAVITGNVDAPSSWQFVQGEWGKDDPKVRMIRVAPNVYQKRLHIRTFYRLPVEAPFLQLAFVFRNQDGSRIASPVDAQEVYYPSTAQLLNLDMQSCHGQDAQFVGNYQSHVLKDHRLLLTTAQHQLLISFFAQGVAQVTLAPMGQSLPPNPPTVSPSTGFAPRSPRLEESDSSLVLRWGAQASLLVQKRPLRLQWKWGQRKALADAEGFFRDSLDQMRGWRWKLSPEEALYGFGSHAFPLNRRGHRPYLYHSRIEGTTKGLQHANACLPVCLSSNGYGLLIEDEAKAYADLGAREAGVWEYGSRSRRPFTYAICLGEDLLELSARLIRLAGLPAMPPRWSLGTLWELEGDPASVRPARELLAKHRLPTDAFLLGQQWEGDTVGQLSWKAPALPLQELRQQLAPAGIQLMLSTSPYVSARLSEVEALHEQGLLATSSTGQPFLTTGFPLAPAALLDLTQPATAHWLQQRLAPLKEAGVAGWVGRWTEPTAHPYNLYHQAQPSDRVHNAYPRLWAQALVPAAEDSSAKAGSSKPLQLLDAAALGTAPLRAFPYIQLRDNYASPVPPALHALLSLQLVGTGFPNIVINNYFIKKYPLFFQQMVQLGATAPMLRLSMQEASALPSFSPALKALLTFRQQLLPYRYTLAWDHTTRGTPMQYPMALAYPSDSVALQAVDQYHWGPDLIVAPDLSSPASSATGIRIYLPAGEWVNAYTGDSLGGRHWHVLQPPPFLPAMVARLGSLIPMLPLPSPTDTLAKASYGSEWMFRGFLNPRHPGVQARVYLDDGEDARAWERDQYHLLSLGGVVDRKKITFTVRQQGTGYEGAPQQTDIYLELHGLETPPKRVKWQKQRLTYTTSRDRLQQEPELYTWDVQRNALLIHVRANSFPAELLIKGKMWDKP